jgi:hypothetical protein
MIPGAPFDPETVAALAALKQADRAAFETLRMRLKKAGCRVTELDGLIAEENDEERGRPPTQADILVRLAEEADLFHTPDEDAYADIKVDGHRETWRVRSRGLRRWLMRRFYEETNGAPNSEAVASAINVIEAKAHHSTETRPVDLRAAGLEGDIYIDLCDKTWRAIKIGAAGWETVESPPVRFRRTPGMQALPEPERGGSISELRPFLNVQSDRDFILVVSWLLAALRNDGPYPVLALAGEQGTAKSTFSKILRALVDPNAAPLRALPREDRDLFIAATNAHMLVFDNVSGLPNWISDTLCRLSTGGGFSVRALYTDNDEVLFDATRPSILNGIANVVTRPDLADRALFLVLEMIPEEKRRPDNELWAEFEAVRPRVLGALLDALVMGLKSLPQTRLPGLPRMADFALWATACEQAFWPAKTFWRAYSENLDEVVNTVIEADLVASTVIHLMEGLVSGEWEGTASRLLVVLKEALEASEEGDVTKSRDWPATPEALSNRLRRAATFLRKVGVEVAFHRRGKKGARMIGLTTTAAPGTDRRGKPASAASAPSAGNRFNDLRAGLADAADAGADVADAAVGPTVSRNRWKSGAADAADAADGEKPPVSAPWTRI